ADRELRHGKPRQGATKFHTIASLYLVHRGERFTLAMTYVWGDDQLTDVLSRLVTRVRGKRIFPRYLLLDRQFYSLEVAQFLQARRLPFVIPVVHRGRRAKDPTKARGTQRFLICRRSCSRTHVLRNNDRTASVKIAVAVDYPSGKKRRRHKWRGRPRRRVLVFAVWGFRPRSPAWVREEYRRR